MLAIQINTSPAGGGVRLNRFPKPNFYAGVKAMNQISDDRVSRFHVGQVWETPRGTVYKVESVVRGGDAVLRQGENGNGRKVKRAWDDVINWVLKSDA
jgi:hypothetical protein